MKKLPLFFYPSTLIIVSKDVNYIKILSYFSNKRNNALSVLSCADAIQLLACYRSYLLDNRLLPMSVCNQNNFDLSILEEMTRVSDRHQEISIIITDLTVSDEVVLEFARACAHLPIGKIILTELSEKNNQLLKQSDGSLSQFIIKDDKNMPVDFLRAIDELTYHYFCEMTSPLRIYLEFEGQLPISDPVFIQFFIDYCIKNNVNEYYLVDKLGSFYCIDTYDHHFYFILHTNASLEFWLGKNEKKSSFFVDDVRARKRIPFFMTKKEDCKISAAGGRSEFGYIANILKGREDYYWGTTKREYNIDEKPELIFELLE